MSKRKRVSLKEYCDGMLKHIFSSHYKDFANVLLDACGPTFRNGIDREWYLLNLHAAIIQLLGVTFSRTLKNYDQRFEALSYRDAFLKETGQKEIESLYSEYNQAFGSDPVDGVRAMAKLFARNCSVDFVETKSIEEIHYNAFYEVLRTFFDNIKTVKIV